MKLRSQFSLLVLLGGLLASRVAHADTSDVYQLALTIRGVTQWGTTGTPTFAKVQILDVDLINLGLGYPLGTPVPANEKLALTITCGSPDMQMIVYDVNSGENLVTLAEMPAVSVVTNQKKNKITWNIVSEVLFQFTATPSNGLGGGVMFANGEMDVDTNGCPRKYSGKMTGALGGSFAFTNLLYIDVVDITVTNLVTNSYFVVSNFPVNVSSNPLSTPGKKLGTLVDP